MLNVSVKSTVFGAGDDAPALPVVNLRLVSRRVPARALIAQAVAEQIRALQQEHKADRERIERALARQYLAEADIERQVPAGKVALASPSKRAQKKRPEPLREDAEIDRALEAFRSGSYKMFVDTTEVTDLDQLCTVREGAAITFVRLLPLQGG